MHMCDVIDNLISVIQILLASCTALSTVTIVFLFIFLSFSYDFSSFIIFRYQLSSI